MYHGVVGAVLRSLRRTRMSSVSTRNDPKWEQGQTHLLELAVPHRNRTIGQALVDRHASLREEERGRHVPQGRRRVAHLPQRPVHDETFATVVADAAGKTSVSAMKHVSGAGGALTGCPRGCVETLHAPWQQVRSGTQMVYPRPCLLHASNVSHEGRRCESGKRVSKTRRDFAGSQTTECRGTYMAGVWHSMTCPIRLVPNTFLPFCMGWYKIHEPASAGATERDAT